jgi:hypothetical protein
MTDGPVTPPPPPGGMPGAPASLIDRVKNILMTPKTEWPRIDAEPASVAGLFTGYAMILAAIGPIATLIGQQLFGYSFFGVTWKPSIGYSIGNAVIAYISTLVGAYVLGLIINALAPSFGGQQDQLKAMKVAIYCSTAAWVAGIFAIVPMLGLLAIFGLIYGLYLLYLGLPVLMRVPPDKLVGYFVVIIVVMIVLYFVIGMIVTALTATFFGAMGPAAGPVIRY